MQEISSVAENLLASQEGLRHEVTTTTTTAAAAAAARSFKINDYRCLTKADYEQLRTRSLRSMQCLLSYDPRFPRNFSKAATDSWSCCT
jgi:hypothetical protein